MTIGNKINRGGKQLCIFLEEVETKRLEEKLQGGYDWDSDLDKRIAKAVVSSAELRRFRLSVDNVTTINGKFQVDIPRSSYGDDFILNDVETKSLARTLMTALHDEELEIKFLQARLDKDFDGITLYFEKY